MKLRDDIPLIGADKPNATKADIAAAAERTATALRSIAVRPEIVEQDRPVLLMAALGWEEFGRQIVKDVN